MQRLYKYLKKPKSHDFYLKPTVKLSVPKYLNDPFESSISEELIKAKFDEEAIDVEWDCTEHIYGMGVLSLSETSRNLLMWAHYADEHKGICIGYNKDVLSSLKPYNKKTGCDFYYPERVTYDNLRFDSNESNKDIPMQASDIVRQVLTIKSDDWMYEKEHRCIVPIGWSDRAIQTTKNIGFKRKINKLMDEGYDITIEPLKGNSSEVIVNEYKDEVFERLSELRGMLFLKQINPKMIETIHLGYRYHSYAAEVLVDEFSKKSHPLHHVKLYKYEISKIKFELEAKLLYTPE
ncbi:DUF2971 domain-containing protein [Aeromonas jandaei]|uniref:DUF2971 domain-containing protein n=1 Tax=Aeromonas jandaei TaxID=650 RepID=UPI00227C2753|nr:DUF2971 domain-containing protein [Aeromonas jandaei]WAG07936.1 DUF2971 domain-containing protein [Aeromonas jandaei]